MRPSVIDVEEQRAVVAYCDTTGFMNWVKRSGASRTDVRSFIHQMYLQFRTFKEDTGYHTLKAGDGIIAIMNLAKANGKDVLTFLAETTRLQKVMERLIKATPYPRPAGFRVRVTAGLIYRIMDDHEVDYIGDCINLGSRLLEVKREVSAITHESVLELLSEHERKTLTLDSLKFTGRPPRGVDAEDMNGLFAFTCK